MILVGNRFNQANRKVDAGVACVVKGFFASVTVSVGPNETVKSKAPIFALWLSGSKPRQKPFLSKRNCRHGLNGNCSITYKRELSTTVTLWVVYDTVVPRCFHYPLITSIQKKSKFVCDNWEHRGQSYSILFFSKSCIDHRLASIRLL